MPRLPRVVIPGVPHHITQRGNYRQKVFTTDDDRNRYLEWIFYYSRIYGVQIVGYRLMDNHVHFIAIPKEKQSFSRVFNLAHMRYSQYVNKKTNELGHLWRGRFYSSTLDKEYFKEALRYVDRNPVRAGMTKNAWDYTWSSAREHVGGTPGKLPILKLNTVIGMSEKEWKLYLEEKDHEEHIENLKKNTLNGRPSGSEAFIKSIEVKLKRRIKLLPRGRPFKYAEKAV